MKKIFTLVSITFIFGLFLFSYANAHEVECKCAEKSEKQVSEQQTVQTVEGVVTAVGENGINVQDDISGTIHKLWSDNPGLIRHLEPGYRVEITYLGNSIQKLKTLGVPVKAEPTMIRVN